MSVGLSATQSNALLDALCRGIAYSVPAAVWIKLHIGDPGAAGTSNPAVETDRVQATFAAAASGSIANNNTLTWASVAGSEDYTHFSAWDASVAGNFLFSGTITANPVSASDDFMAAIGALITSLTTAA